MHMHTFSVIAASVLWAASITVALEKYLKLIPNSQLAEDAAHDENKGLKPFAEAFAKCGHTWEGVCKEMYDDVLTYGDLFGDSCCQFPKIKVETLTALMSYKPEDVSCDNKGDGGKKTAPAPSDPSPGVPASGGPGPGGSSLLQAKQTEHNEGSKVTPPETSPDKETSC